MRNVFLLVSLSVLLILAACSKNENPVEPETPALETIKLTVTFGEAYYIKFSDKSEVTVADPLLDAGWDIVVDNLTRAVDIATAIRRLLGYYEFFNTSGGKCG